MKKLLILFLLVSLGLLGGTSNAAITQTNVNGLQLDCGSEAGAAATDLCLEVMDIGSDASVLDIDGNGDITFRETGGSTSDPDFDVNGYANFDGAVELNSNTTLGSAVTDITTLTGKIAGATPINFDGSTADTVYTAFAITDPTSSTKTITFPAVTGTVQLTGAVTALTPGTSVTLTVQAGSAVFSDTITTDNQDQTIDASGAGSAGDRMTIIFVTDAAGIGDEVITFGTNIISTGTLTLANLASDVYTVSFVSDGTRWLETARTAVQTT